MLSNMFSVFMTTSDLRNLPIEERADTKLFGEKMLSDLKSRIVRKETIPVNKSMEDLILYKVPDYKILNRCKSGLLR